MADQLEIGKARMQSPHCVKGDFFILDLIALLVTIRSLLLGALAMWSWGNCCPTHHQISV